MQDTRVVLIVGPRQAGKTTLARLYATRDRPYLTLDDPATLAAARSDPTGFVRGLKQAVIDEVQRAPDLLLAIKESVDKDQTPGRFLLTGSTTLKDRMRAPATSSTHSFRDQPINFVTISAPNRYDNDEQSLLDNLVAIP